VANIATTTNTNPLGYPGNTLLDRQPSTGHLFALLKGSTADTYDVYKSTDNGTTWASYVSLTRTAVQEIGSIYAHNDNWLYWCYRTNESSQDRVYFRRLNLASGVWDAEFLVGNPGNAGVAGAVFTGMDLIPVVTQGNTFVAVAVGHVSGSQQGVTLHCVYINPHGEMADGNIFIGGNRQWFRTGSGRNTPSLDIEHNGDGKSSSSPHLWMAFGRTETMLVKLSWSGQGWTGPSNYIEIDYQDPAMDSLPARYDGSRFLMVVPNAWANSKVTIYERNKANSSTTRRDTPTHPAGVPRHATLAYDPSTGDFRVYAVGTSNNDLYWVQFTRGSGTYGAWATVTTDDIVGTGNRNYGVRRSNYGNSIFSIYYARTTAPQVQHVSQVIAVAPSTPTWASPVNGSAADVAASLVLDWNFIDIDPADTQKDFALSRQVGAGSLEYWNNTTNLWSGTEVKNALTTSAKTLTATQWSLDGLANGASDANHTWKVKVWDSTDAASGYSAGLVLIPSAKVEPSITSPTAAQVINVNTVTVTWTVAQQSAYKLTLATNPGGVAVYDSSKVTSTATSVVIPYTFPDGTGWTINLTTWNTEGLASTTQTRNFTVDIIEPATPTLVVTALPTSGVVRVAIINPTPGGGQPAVTSQELSRRQVGDTDDGTRLRTGLASGATVDDWKAVSGVSYAYRVKVYGANGTSTFSAWTT
jgi:hypothetical protein